MAAFLLIPGKFVVPFGYCIRMRDSYIYYPEALSGQQLDRFLARGWYRMGQGLFTTHYIIQQAVLYRVYWLRYDLEKVRFGKSRQKLMSQHKKFTVSVKPVQVSDELEELYALYKSAIPFEPAESVTQWLFEDRDSNVFDTECIEVRDGRKLIAAGVYDKGLRSIAGIMNFYHPDYKKYSPGKFLMLLKTDLARAAGCRWYYPGYIVQGYPKFDYKLFIDKKAAELYIPERNGWQVFDPSLLMQPGDQPGDWLS